MSVGLEARVLKLRAGCGHNGRLGSVPLAARSVYKGRSAHALKIDSSGCVVLLLVACEWSGDGDVGGRE